MKKCAESLPKKNDLTKRNQFKIIQLVVLIEEIYRLFAYIKLWNYLI